MTDEYVFDANEPVTEAEDAAAERRAEPVGERQAHITDALDWLDAAIDDTHPEGDGCDICRAADVLREAIEALIQPVEASGEHYWLVDGERVGPVMDGHVFADTNPDAKCPDCWRSAKDHLPAAARRLMGLPIERPSDD